MAASAPARPGPVRPDWRFRARQLAWAGFDIVFPPQCGGCGRPGQRLCAECQAAFVPLGPAVCAACGYAVQANGQCPRCRPGSPALAPLAGLRSAAFFEGTLQLALHRLKYKHDVILADTLAVWLAEAWHAYRLPDGVVVPVPLAAERQRERGYNQAGLLARGLAQLAGLRLNARAAMRVRNTASQVGLSVEQRLANVRGAFRAQPAAVAGRTIILVDDVCTTGATLAACAEALKAAGAAAVWGLTLARARLPRPGRAPAARAAP